jgi:hypothetical protein
MSNRDPQAQPVSPSTQMMQFLWPGAMAVQAIHVAAKFALADLVAGGPKSTNELADATQYAQPVDGPVLAGAHKPRDLCRGPHWPVSTNGGGSDRATVVRTRIRR